MFKNRVDAGKKLAEKIDGDKLVHPLILGLPRGGVPVAKEVAKSIGAPLDVLVVKKIGLPNHPELAAGAICEGEEEPVWNESVLNAADITRERLSPIIEKKKQEITQAKQLYREGKDLPNLENRDIVLVDDGIATGATVKMALKALRNKTNTSRIILACPIAAKSSLEELSDFADETICVEAPTRLQAVGQWYDDFSQTTDEEVLDALREKQDMNRSMQTEHIEIPLENISLEGDLTKVRPNKAWLVFVHGSGSSHKSPRNRFVAEELNKAGYSTLLFDLLSPQEDLDRAKVFDIDLLSNRLNKASLWLSKREDYDQKPLVYFGASTGAAAALVSASEFSGKVSAVISRGGRPDLAIDRMGQLEIPVYLVIGEEDRDVIKMNHRAAEQLMDVEIEIIPRAGHLFSEEGTLEDVAEKVIKWLDERKLDKGVH